MIARFQNSSLLEKDDEYKPLLFYSSGPDKGNPEPFIFGPRYKKKEIAEQGNNEEYVEYDENKGNA
jgi:hypothetical protein